MPVSRARRVEIADRRTKLVKYRLAGRRYQDFYEELGYASPKAASRDFNRTLEESIAEQRSSMEVHREAELMKLDDLAVQATRILLTPHYVVTQAGKIVDDPRTGQPMRDDGPALAAIDRLVRIGDRRAKLLGLDAPQRMEVLTLDAIDAHIAELNELVALADLEAAEAAAAEGAAD